MASSRRLFEIESVSHSALPTSAIPPVTYNNANALMSSSPPPNPSINLRNPIDTTNNSPLTKRFLCEICGRRFAHQGSLSRHVRAHSNDRPYHCRICLRRFQQAGNLNVHLRSHTDARPYECDHCERKFRHPSSLNSHRRKKHPGENQ
jgi:KRAB domain-containing zinc finger protein